MNFNLRVSMVSLMHNNLQAGIDFYKQLELPVTFQVPGKWAEFDLQGVKLFLYQVDEELPDHYSGLVLHVDDVHKFYDAFKDRITFVTPPTDLEYAYIARIKDPGNNIIGLVQPTPERVREKMSAQQEMQESDCCKDGKCQC
ncbi:MAG: Glyoxalase-like domain protein [Candidatus Dependentiae bacterium ADurb.Bin331]|nr:MAG: Glyoxalase-like domain protein [Candidatus Dependentiae bacterium ADurb.Bin331]